MQKLVKLLCPVCNDDNFSVYYSNIKHICNIQKILNISDEEVESVNINKCNNCKHHYLGSVINNDLMSVYYNQINSEYYSLNQKIENKLEKENKRNVDFLLKFRTQGKMLEIGCGYGFLLKEFEKKGFEVFGLEPSPHASEYASKTLKVPIHNGFLIDGVYEKESFDCIVLFDVFEHIYNINDLMKSITSLLKPGGCLLIGTGDINSKYAKFSGKYWWYLSSWEHISFFSKESITYLLNMFEYKNICVQNISHKGSYLFNVGIVLKSILKRIANMFVTNKYTLNVAFDHFLIYAVKK